MHYLPKFCLRLSREKAKCKLISIRISFSESETNDGIKLCLSYVYVFAHSLCLFRLFIWQRCRNELFRGKWTKVSIIEPHYLILSLFWLMLLWFPSQSAINWLSIFYILPVYLVGDDWSPSIPSEILVTLWPPPSSPPLPQPRTPSGNRLSLLLKAVSFSWT